MLWELLADYTNFFVGDYLDQFRTAEGDKDFSKDAVIEALCKNRDCSAVVKSAEGWESRRVRELLGAQDVPA